MITAVDTSILLDILAQNSEYFERSKTLYEKALVEGSTILCPVVWAELRPFFNSDHEFENIIKKLELRFVDFGPQASSLAGQLWQEYRLSKGKRDHLIPDFLVGAHATIHANRLLTRDRGFYRKYFTALTLLEP